jgi:hypothetical protein
MPSPKVKTMTLEPDAIFASWHGHLRETDAPPFCGPYSGGLAPTHGYPAGNVIWSGFDYVSWSYGWFCSVSIDYVFRGGVHFDLKLFQDAYGKGYYMPLSALLVCWQQEPHDECAGGSTLIYTANGDWPHGVLDGYLIPTSRKDEDYVDTIPPFTPAPDGALTGLVGANVTPQFERWVSGAEPNFGFCFMGTDEGMPDDGNSTCVNQFALFQLQVTYLSINDWPESHPIFPGPHQVVPPRRPLAPNLPVHTIDFGNLPQSLQQRLRQPRQAPGKQ